jgi:hypothetical protein
VPNQIGAGNNWEASADSICDGFQWQITKPLVDLTSGAFVTPRRPISPPQCHRTLLLSAQISGASPRVVTTATKLFFRTRPCRCRRVLAVIWLSVDPRFSRGTRGSPFAFPRLQLIDIPVLESVNVDGMREVELFVIQPSLDRSRRPAVPLGDLCGRQILAS